MAAFQIRTSRPPGRSTRCISITGAIAVAASGDAAIAVRGSWGSFAESAFAKLLGRPVVVLEPGWRIDGFDTAAMPAEAVD